ncbi:ATP-binding protein [Methanoplanus endosymbiosus]|uniref:ATP-binding protein n=1 Tax=Methanoplanus endosymbiosus TaxID=33865 RepID=A0A9E7PQ41_9EURY|nr:ATP-binding protein [Methanoplanus endosymbiosus]UUX92964.1 ATP-binding protein [Methanoplanus endosymbiosus]
MKRLIYGTLLEWKESEDRKPVILEGIRQCGKTWILKHFGEAEFKDVAYFNFEYDDRLQKVFDGDLNVSRIIKDLGILRNKSIRPKTTLLILDEIQICPRAITSLKYFCENLPGLHITAAGSLLGVAVAQMGKNISFPVGKVQMLKMYPLSFPEFLLAKDEELLYGYLSDLSHDEEISSAFTGRLEEAYREYLITGGMPEVVSSWINNHDIVAVETIQSEILSDYEKDFVKYASVSEFPKLTLIWNAIPAQLAKDNQKFIFSHVKHGMRARDLEDSLQWLISAGLIYKVGKIERPYIPVTTYADTTYFKIYFSDVGLLRRMSKFPADVVFDTSSLTADMRGILTENFVLTELIANGFQRPYFWKSGGIAEVDYIIQEGIDVIPVEVKSAKGTRSRSLTEYRKKYRPTVAIRTSLNNIARHSDEYGEVLEMPLYLIWRLKAYI